jgi:hypothetical protein
MRVENSAINGATADLYTPAAGKGTQSSVSTAAAGSDRSSLSGASELVAMAKSLMPADYASRFEAIHASVNAGEYQADTTAMSQALVDKHLST